LDNGDYNLLEIYSSGLGVCTQQNCDLNNDNVSTGVDTTLLSLFVGQGLQSCAIACAGDYTCQEPTEFDTKYCLSDDVSDNIGEQFDNNLSYDYNSDLIVNETDAEELIEVIFNVSKTCPIGKVCDINNDTNTDSYDVSLLRLYFNQGLDKCIANEECTQGYSCQVPSTFITKYCISTNLTDLGYPERNENNSYFDYNNDARVNMEDVDFLSVYIYMNTSCGLNNCDINNDSSVDSNDVDILDDYLNQGLLECEDSCDEPAQSCLEPTLPTRYCAYQHLLDDGFPVRYEYNEMLDYNDDFDLTQTDVDILNSFTNDVICSVKDCDVDNNYRIDSNDADLLDYYLIQGTDVCIDATTCVIGQICEKPENSTLVVTNETYYFDVNYPLAENEITTFDFICNDSGEIVEIFKDIEVDSRRPTISTLTSESGFIYDVKKNKFKIVRGNETHGSTRFFVEADEEVICRYDDNLSHFMFNDMDYEFQDSDEEWRYKYISKSENLYLLNGTGNNIRGKEYYVSCQDKAGNDARAFKEIYLNVDIGRNVNIYNATPENDIYVNSEELVISFETMELAECSIDVDSDKGSLWDKVKDFLSPPDELTDENETIISYHHTYTITNLTDGYGDLDDYPGFKKYGFEIECKDPNGIFFDSAIKKSFKVDITSPEFDIDEIPSEPVDNSNVSFRFNTENESRNIKIYVNGNLQQEFTESTFGYNYRSGDIDTVIYLTNGTNEVLLVVEDKAGNVNTKQIAMIFNNRGPFATRVIPDRGIFRSSDEFDNRFLGYLYWNYYDVDYDNSSITLTNDEGTMFPIDKIDDNTTLNYTLNSDLPNDDYSLLVESVDINGSVGEMRFHRFTIDDNASIIELLNNADTFDLDNRVINQRTHNLTIHILPKYYYDEIDTAIFVLNGQTYNLRSNITNNLVVDFAEGLNEYYIYANTTLGYGAETYTYYTWLDTVAPEAVICIGFKSCAPETQSVIVKIHEKIQGSISYYEDEQITSSVLYLNTI